MTLSQEQWRKRAANTLTFYRKKLYYKERQFNLITPLAAYFGEMIGDKTDVTIADLGAGMFSTTGSTWHSATVHLYPSDILADEFNEMLKERCIPVIPVERQDMGALTYADNFFDIVHCVNALDHCLDPLKALLEMYRVCKPGGWIYLRHFHDNAQYEKYSGFHLWNIRRTEDGDCLFWNRFNRFLLSRHLPGFTNIIRTDVEDRELTIVSTMRKAE